MRSRETALKLKRFEMAEKARKAADLERMIGELECMAADLDRQIEAEEELAGVKDPQDLAYSTFAKSAILRRDNLRASIAELHVNLKAALRERDEAREQLNSRPEQQQNRNDERPVQD